MFALAGVVAFGLSSCGDDPEDVAKPTPKFDFKSGGAYTSTNVEVNGQTILEFGIDATGSENLESVGVRVSKNGGSETILPLGEIGDSIIKDEKLKNFEIDFEYETGIASGTEKITVIVKMTNGTQTSKSIVITNKGESKQLSEAPGRQMGAQNNATYGSYWSMSQNQYLFQTEANTTPADVDWVYYYGASNKATFAAPDDPTLQSSNVMGNPSLTSWAVKNNTRFKKLATGYDFDAKETSDEIQGEMAGATLSSISDMQVGDVYFFVTANQNEFGIIKITGVTTGGGSELGFDMKYVSK